MIITKKIQFVVNKGNISYLKKIINNTNLKLNESIIVDVDLLSHKSMVKIDAKCDNCDSINNITYYSYIRNISKYGMYTCPKCKNVKYKLTCEDKYNTDNYSKTPEFIEKFKNTSMDRYGVDNPMKNDEIKNKSVLTTYNITIDNLNNISNEWEIISRNKNLYTILCKNCNTIFEINDKLLYRRIGLKSTICLECNPKNISHQSGQEKQLISFILNNYNNILNINNNNILNGIKLKSVRKKVYN